MKKNEHYFPTMEWIKDPAEPCGWRRNTYEGGKMIAGEVPEGVVPMVEEVTEVGDAAQPFPEGGDGDFAPLEAELPMETAPVDG